MAESNPNFWTLIGISSLISAIVSGIINIFSGYYLEQKRFNREKETEFVKKQIELHFKLYYFLRSISLVESEIWGKELSDAYRDTASWISESTNYFNFETLNSWYELCKLFDAFYREVLDEEINLCLDRKKDLLYKVSVEHEKLMDLIKTKTNNTFIKKYQKICGETVPRI